MADKLTEDLINGNRKLVEEFKSELIKLLTTTRGLSGDSKTVKSLEVEFSYTGRYVRLIGVEYFYYVINGRGPGRFPPPDEFGNWVVPFPIAQKIAAEGNKAEYKHVADEFDELFNKFVERVKKSSGEITLAFIRKNNVID